MFRDHRARVGILGKVMRKVTEGVILSNWVDFHGVFLAIYWCSVESTFDWCLVLRSGSNHLSGTSSAIVFTLCNFSQRLELWSD